MNDGLNIEDLFKNTLEGHKVEPKTNVWNGIRRKLWVREFRLFFRNSFENFKIDPSASVWPAIVRKLWLYQFLRFSPSTFNIYYVGLTAALLSGIYFLPDISGNKEITASNNITPEIKKENTITKPIPPLVVPSNTTSNSALIANNTGETRKIETDVKTTSAKKAEQNNNAIVNFLNKGTAKNIPANKFFTKQQANPDNFLVAFNAEAPVNNTVISNENRQPAEMTLENILSIKPHLPITPFKETYPDTVAFNVIGMPIIIENALWSVDAYWMPMINQSSFTSKNTEFDSYVKMRKNQTSQAFSFPSFGASVNFSYKNWIFQVGLAYTQLTEKIRVPNTVTYGNPHSTIYNSHHGYFINDSIGFLNLDSLLGPNHDTVWIYIPYPRWNVVNSSLIIDSYDSANVATYKEIINKYSYLEIPVMAGYQVKNNKFSFALKGGIAFGFLMSANGKTISPSGYNSLNLENTNLPFVQTNFTLLFGFGINYHLTYKLAIFGEPVIRKNLNSMFENRLKITQKFQSGGVKFGVRYIF
ncbi:MAG: hypothetical protein HY840_00170 [Bacteroidetes bacterium]|nr:hypothetical protein [Bacteroidota bacterium]